MHIPLGTLKFRDGVVFQFPNHLCCNCGAKADLKVLSQDTRRTTYLVAGGTETTFQLPLPFCSRCAPSAKRRPKNIVHRLLLFALAWVLGFAGLILLGELGFLPTSLAGHLSVIAGALAAVSTAAVILLARPATGQSSYFQPVRIPQLKREFLSGAVTAIGFSFTNREYAAAFSQLNREAIARKQLLVTGA